MTSSHKFYVRVVLPIGLVKSFRDCVENGFAKSYYSRARSGPHVFH